LSVELENKLASRKPSVPITARWLVYRFRKLIQSFNLCTTYITHDCSTNAQYGENCIKYLILFTMHKEFKREREN